MSSKVAEIPELGSEHAGAICEEIGARLAHGGHERHRRIRKRRYAERSRPKDALFRHCVSREIIARTIRESTADHPPRRGAIKAGTESDILSAVYTSDCSGLLQGLDLWIYGHTHERRDFTVGHPSEMAEW
jgi:hypothetical protein